MRTLIIAVAATAALAIVGVVGWQAKAAAPAAPIPQAGLYTPIHPADCRGTTGGHGCGAGFYWRNGARGWACYAC
jgi:hypothetical protein